MSSDYIDKQEYIQSQYSNSPTIKQILNDFRDYIRPETDIQTIYDNIINIDTAQGVGLDYWGRIIGVRREIFVDDTSIDYPVFGFRNSGLNPFNQGVFITLSDLISGNRIIAVLNDEQYRRLLYFKALANISSADLATLNKITSILFNNTTLTATNILSEGTLTNGDKYNSSPMQVRFLWREKDVSNINRAMFEQCIILSLSAGVGYTLNFIADDVIFGFSGSGLNPFNQGIFGTITT